jgi:hypothetical protein
MKKLVSFLLSLAFVLSANASADVLSDCTDDANRVRYSEEVVCYGDYGPKSGNYETRDTSPLDGCLDDVHVRFSRVVFECQEMNMVEAGPGINKPAATSAGTAAGLLIFFML